MSSTPEQFNSLAEEGPEVEEVKLLELEVEKLGEGLNEPFHDPEIIEAYARLALKLKNRLEEYDTILSDDARGRLTSRVIHRLINKERDGAGLPAADIRFLALTTHEWEDNEEGRNSVIRYLSGEQSNGITQEKRKILVVTEAIYTGSTIRGLENIFQELGITDYDVATLTIDPERPKLASRFPQWIPRRQPFYGKVKQYSDLDIDLGPYSGVDKFEKKHFGKTSRVKKSKIEKAFPGKSLAADQAKINRARKEAFVLADRLYDLIHRNELQTERTA